MPQPTGRQPILEKSFLPTQRWVSTILHFRSTKPPSYKLFVSSSMWRKATTIIPYHWRGLSKFYPVAGNVDSIRLLKSCFTTLSFCDSSRGAFKLCSSFFDDLVIRTHYTLSLEKGNEAAVGIPFRIYSIASISVQWVKLYLFLSHSFHFLHPLILH